MHPRLALIRWLEVAYNQRSRLTNKLQQDFGEIPSTAKAELSGIQQLINELGALRGDHITVHEYAPTKNK